jgi:hypothetical protein
MHCIQTVLCVRFRLHNAFKNGADNSTCNSASSAGNDEDKNTNPKKNMPNHHIGDTTKKTKTPQFGGLKTKSGNFFFAAKVLKNFLKG